MFSSWMRPYRCQLTLSLIALSLIAQCSSTRNEGTLREKVLGERPNWVKPGHSYSTSAQISAGGDEDCGQLKREIRDTKELLNSCQETVSFLQVKCDGAGGDAENVLLSAISRMLRRKYEDAAPKRDMDVELRVFLSKKTMGVLQNLKNPREEHHLIYDMLDDGISTASGSHLEPHWTHRFLDVFSLDTLRDLRAGFHPLPCIRSLIVVMVLSLIYDYFGAMRVKHLVSKLSAICFFWTWQTLIVEHVLKNIKAQDAACKESSLWNWSASTAECDHLLKKMHEKYAWEVNPGEVLVIMLGRLTGILLGVFSSGFLGHFGDAIRSFIDKQSWTTMLPASLMLLAFMIILLVILCGGSISCLGISVASSPAIAEPAWGSPVRSPVRFSKKRLGDIRRLALDDDGYTTAVEELKCSKGW